jgi:beta-lactamase regulating signal transducer with metallopeptidase domain
VESIFLKILNMSITASYVILAVLAIRLFLRKAPKKYSYLLWSVVGFRLICPVSFSSVVSILNTLDLSNAQTSSAALNYIPRDIGHMANPRVTIGVPFVNSAISDSLPAPAPMASVNPLQVWITIGTVLWCVGIAALLIYSVVTYLKIKGRMATAVFMDTNVYESDQIRSPFILGFIRPKVYIPFGLSEKEKDYILRHEAYHIRRGDHLIKPLAFLILVIHWFNPSTWLAFALMTKDMEMSCDEKVLSVTGPGIVRDYSLSLLSFAANLRFPCASPLAFGETGIKQRVKNVLNFKKPKVWVIIIAALLCIAVIAACGANPNKNNDTPPDITSLYGRYKFSETIYMNPLSSSRPIDENMPFYILSADGLVIEELDGTETKVPGVYEAVPVNEEDFKEAFITDVRTPRISAYKVRYQFTLNEDSSSYPVYRIYYLDGRIWLARLHHDKMWSIFELVETADLVPENSNPEKQTPEDPSSQVQQLLYALFDSGNRMQITLEVTGHDPRTIETNDRWFAERYAVLLNEYSWRLAQEDVIPSSFDYSLTLYSADKSTSFRFFADSNAVFYSAEGTKNYYLATAEDGNDITAKLRAEYDSLEGSYQLVFVETPSRDFTEVASLFMQEYGKHQLALSPGSTYAITDFKVIKIEVYLTEDGDDTKFCFWTTFAVKPADYDDTSPWWAGNSEAGRGKLKGYLTMSRQLRLEREGNIWRCTNMGTGGVPLE